MSFTWTVDRGPLIKSSGKVLAMAKMAKWPNIIKKNLWTPLLLWQKAKTGDFLFDDNIWEIY